MEWRKLSEAEEADRCLLVGETCRLRNGKVVEVRRVSAHGDGWAMTVLGGDVVDAMDVVKVAKQSTSEDDMGTGGGQALDGERLTAFKMDPFKLKIPGLDPGGPTELVKAHADRVTSDLREGFVDSIRKNGVLETVTVWKDGSSGDVWLINGVQRVRAARIVTLERRKAGDKDYVCVVPCLSPRKGLDEVQRFAVALELNAMRKDDPPMVRARKAAELLQAAGGDVNVVAHVFGISRASVNDFVRVHEATPELKAAVAAGPDATDADGNVIGTSMGVAVEISKLPQVDQAPTLAGLLKEKGGATVDKAKQAVRSKKGTSSKSGTRPTTELVREIVRTHQEGDVDHLDKHDIKVLNWILTGASPELVKGLVAAIRYAETPRSERGK